MKKNKGDNKGANDKWANLSSKPMRRPPALALGVVGKMEKRYTNLDGIGTKI